MDEKTGRLEHEAFRARLPYATVATNVPGVFATAPLPAGFDVHTATEHALVKNGLLWRRPKPGDPSVVRRAWERAFARPWSPDKHVVPEMKAVVGRTHRWRPRAITEATRGSSNWSGGVLDGNWTVVSGFWTVPTVSKPREGQGPGSGWYSASWLGIDGDSNTDDLLQAGVEQQVDGNGSATYVAWYEWFTEYRRVTLGDTTPSNYALVSADDGTLYLAFRGEQNHVDVMFSTDSGNSFGNKLTSGELTSQGPALAFHQGSVIVAWVGTGNGQLTVAEVTRTGNTLSLSGKVGLGWESTRSPALASFGGTLFIAWKDASDRLNVASSTDGGQSFAGHLVSNETSPQAPTLAVHGSSLLIAWKGDGNDFLNVATVAVSGRVATGITNKTIISSETSPQSPAIASFGGTLFLAWKGDGNDYLNVMQSTDGGRSFFGKYTSFERSPSAPTLAVHANKKLLIGWRGEQDHLDLGAVGVRNGTIVGFSPDPAYYDQMDITNFKVSPGDQVVCSIFYVQQMTAGYIAFANITSGEYFSITLVPPPEADLTGGSIEWIMEAPTLNGQQTVIPKFTQVEFTDAFGCGPNGAVGDPNDGDEVELFNAAGTVVTSVTLASDKVTIDFTG